MMKRALRKLQSYLYQDNREKAKTWLKEHLDGDLSFFVKLSNCKVIDYNNHLFRVRGEQISLRMEMVQYYQYPNGHILYFLEGYQLREMLQLWMVSEGKQRVYFRNLLLLVLPSSVRYNPKNKFLEEQLNYFKEESNLEER